MDAIVLCIPQAAIAQENGNAHPQYNFRTTSMYRLNEPMQQSNASRVVDNPFYGTYSVPMPAQDMSMPDEGTYTPIRRGGSGGGGYGPGYDPEDPFKPPVGDVPWVMMIVMAGIIVVHKTKHLRKQQMAKENGINS
ncbi:MAG: hypothetical protein K6A36_00605 [Paludibacteraceae bacterium]|nr:hypothetical protein [Paludibacteraceae bacterium]